MLTRSVLSLLVVAPMLPDSAAAQRLEFPSAAYAQERRAMVRLIEGRGVDDGATLEAMRSVPRHEFVPAGYVEAAYADHPLPIGYGQTVSQPYIVAYMTELLELEPGQRVLEVGTGSGYQAAVLAAVECRVFTVEIFEALATEARERLDRLGYDSVTVRHADGHFGWEEHAPFQAIIVTAAAGYIPPALVDQLAPGGRMVIPVGNVYGVQNLVLVNKDVEGDVTTRTLVPVRFVPMLSGVR